MGAERGGGAGLADRVGQRPADRLPLRGTRDDAEQPVRVEQARDRQRDGARRHLGDGPERAVVHLLPPADRVERDDLDRQRVGEVGHRRIVEREVAVHPDAEAHDVERRLGEQGRVVADAGLRTPLGLEQVDAAERHAVEERPPQPAPEALRRRLGETEILVHVEGRDAAPVDARLGRERVQQLPLARRRGEHHPHGRPRRQAAAQLGRDVRGRRPAHGGPVRVDADLGRAGVGVGCGGHRRSASSSTRSSNARATWKGSFTGSATVASRGAPSRSRICTHSRPGPAGKVRNT